VKRATFVSLLIVGALLSACQSNKNNSAWSTKQEKDPQSAAAATVPSTPPAAASSASGKGIGPVAEVDLASLDEHNRPNGAQLFQEKCSACHKLDEKYIGPALAGVTQRRQPEWILNMILNPEVMIAQDPTAKALLAQFIAPMANQHLTREQAECILVYFREHDEDVADDEHEDEHEDKDEVETSSAVGQAASGH
jgi:mono/diheme cytochrome c family protein